MIEDMQAEGLWPTKDKWEALWIDMADVKTQMGKIEYQQNEFGKKIDNGVTERLDGLERRHDTLDTKIDGLVVGLATLQGMMQAREGTIDGD